MGMALHIYGFLVAAMVVSAIGMFVTVEATHIVLGCAAGFVWVQVIARR
jgi:hypothetical protein